MPGGFTGFADHRWMGSRWNRGQHVFLGIDERGGVVAGHLETVPVRDRVSRAGFDAISAENAAIVVDVINLRVTLAAADPDLLGVLSGFDVYAVGRARRRAQEAGHALFEAVFIALQHVYAA